MARRIIKNDTPRRELAVLHPKETDLAAPSPVEYDDAIRRLAFEIWLLKADRNCERTALLLRQELDGEIPYYPSGRTIRKWCKSEEWSLQAEDAIKSVAQFLNERDFIRLFALTQEAVRVYGDIIHNDHPEPDPKRLQVIANTATELLKLRGLGTAGGYAPPSIPSITVRNDNPDATPQELARELMEHIAESKQKQADRKGRRY